MSIIARDWAQIEAAFVAGNWHGEVGSNAVVRMLQSKRATPGTAVFYGRKDALRADLRHKKRSVPLEDDAAWNARTRRIMFELHSGDDEISLAQHRQDVLDTLSEAMPRLTPEQRNIAQMLAAGYTQKQVADLLEFSPQTMSAKIKAMRKRVAHLKG